MYNQIQWHNEYHIAGSIMDDIKNLMIALFMAMITTEAFT